MGGSDLMNPSLLLCKERSYLLSCKVMTRHFVECENAEMHISAFVFSGAVIP